MVEATSDSHGLVGACSPRPPVNSVVDYVVSRMSGGPASMSAVLGEGAAYRRDGWWSVPAPAESAKLCDTLASHAADTALR